MEINEFRAARRERDRIRDEIHQDLDVRPSPSKRARLLELNALLNRELDRQFAALTANQPPLSDVKKPGRQSRGTLTQGAVGQILTELMDTPMDDGRPSPLKQGFRLFATVPGSATDMLGMDFLLVLASSGTFMALDATCNPDKGWGGVELPTVRKAGMLCAEEFPHEVEEHGFDNALWALRKDLKERLPKLLKWAVGSPLNLLDLRLPVGVMAGDYWAQVDAHKAEVDSHSAEASSPKSQAARHKLYYEIDQARAAIVAFVEDLEIVSRESGEPESTLLQELAEHLRRETDRSGKSGPIFSLNQALTRLSELIRAAQYSRPRPHRRGKGDGGRKRRR
jgi:hypothetical protein